MRSKIHGWTFGLLLVGAACLGVSVPAASDPPAPSNSSSSDSAEESSEAPREFPGSAPSESERDLDKKSDPRARHGLEQAPESRAATPQPGAPSGVKLSGPLNLPSGSESSGRPARRDARSQPILPANFETWDDPVESAEATSPQAPESDKRPVTQFVRRRAAEASFQPQRPEQDPVEQMWREMQRPGVPSRPPDSAEVPSVVGNVAVQGLDQLGVIILQGSPQDVEAMRKIIEEIQRISAGVEPFVRVFQVHRASATQVRETILELYAGSTSSTTGRSTTTGQATGGAAASSAALQTPVLKRFQIAADERSNTLAVQASPQMMEELARLIERLDVDTAPLVNEARIFQLKNAEATEVTSILTQAIAGSGATTSGATTLGGGAGTTAATVSGGGEVTLSGRGAVLRFVPLDGQSRAIDSGILDTVRVTALVRTNSVFVNAPASSMDLIAAIIAELDKPPSFIASVKVFPLKNSDANNMRLILSDMFDLESSTTTGGGALGGGIGAGATTTQFQRPVAVGGGGDHPPISIRVAVDSRTNSLIISGPDNALLVVEAVIKKLDLVLGADYNRKSMVYRLKNSQAIDVATALTTFFTNKRTIEAQQTATTGTGSLVGAYQRLEQDIVVVALDNALAASLTTVANPPATSATQGVNNLLLISASPRYYDLVIKMLEELDAPQPQVMIQVMIAQLTLTDDFEFGIEFGAQNSILFDRGGAPGAPPAAGTTVAPGLPGFNFNTSPVPGLGNTNAANPGQVGGQGLSNFSLGRVGIDNLGGMILTASSQNISALLRTLQANGNIEVISRPQIMTLDGRTARVTVGESFPYVGNVNITTTATIPTVSFQNIGVTLTVKPSITPDDRIYLEVVPEVTELKELVNVQSINTPSGIINQQAPRTTQTAANTVVIVNNGQTIVLGGLIQKRNNDFVRKIPWLGDLPGLGFLFRYTQKREFRQELLVIMTPHIVRNDADAQRIKDLEVARTNWVLCNGPWIHGDFGLTQEEPEPNSAQESTPVPAVEQSGGPQIGGVQQMEFAEPLPASTVPAAATVAQPEVKTAPEPVRASAAAPQHKSLGSKIRGMFSKSSDK